MPTAQGVTMPKAQLTVDARPTTNLALAHAGAPLVDGVRVRWLGDERVVGAQLLVSLGHALTEPVRRELPTMHPEEVLEVDAIPLTASPERLRAVTDAETLTLTCALLVGGAVVAEVQQPLQVLPWDAWPGDHAPPAALAVFVTSPAAR